MSRTSKNARAIFYPIFVCSSFLVASDLPLRAQQVNYTPYAFTTIAGAASIGNQDGTGTAARFNRPENAVVDASGNIYVADTVNNTIREVSPSSTNWNVTTIAGAADVSGSARWHRLCGPIQHARRHRDRQCGRALR